MGYWSDVAFVVPNTAPQFEEIDDEIRLAGERSGYRLYTAKVVKWYESYPLPIAVMKYLDSLEPDKFRFLRVGEDDDDTEDLGCLIDNPFDLGFAKRITHS
jgi:hypothetical protein